MSAERNSPEVVSEKFVREHNEWLANGDPLDVAKGLLLRAVAYLPDNSSIEHDIKVFLWRFEE